MARANGILERYFWPDQSVVSPSALPDDERSWRRSGAHRGSPFRRVPTMATIQGESRNIRPAGRKSAGYGRGVMSSDGRKDLDPIE